MIKNSSQLTQAKQSREELRKKLEVPETSDDLLERMQRASYECRFHDIEEEIKEYESLLTNTELSFSKESLPKMITSLRIASGYTQKALAEELGLPEQQIQRYEQQEYGKVKFERAVQIIRVLTSRIAISARTKQELTLPFNQTPITFKATETVQKRGLIMSIGA